MKNYYVMFKHEGSYRIEHYYRAMKRKELYKDLRRGFIHVSLNISYGYRSEKIPLCDVIGYRKNKEDFQKDFPQYFI